MQLWEVRSVWLAMDSLLFCSFSLSHGDSVRKRLRLLWSFASMKVRFIAWMFFLPSHVMRPTV